MENKDNKSRVDRVMSSLDGLTRSTAPDFFYTRLIGRMQSESEPKRKPSFILRPAFITSVLSIALMINIAFLMQENKPAKQNAVTNTGKPATLESFAKAYNMDAESLYE